MTHNELQELRRLTGKQRLSGTPEFDPVAEARRIELQHKFERCSPEIRNALRVADSALSYEIFGELHEPS